MTNMKHYENLPLVEAWKKYNYEYDNGLIDDDVDFEAWLVDQDYNDLSFEQLLAAYQFSPVSGYLLEFFTKDGEWVATEFDCGWYPNVFDRDELFEVWDGDGVQIGFYPELGEDVWLSSSDDWDSRLGVDFNADTTPKQFASPIGVWGGEINENGNKENGDLWRVRKVTVSGAWSENAKRFFRRYPNALPKSKSRFVKIDMKKTWGSGTDESNTWTEWFCFDSVWCHPYNRDGRNSSPYWDKHEEFQMWCKQTIEAHPEKEDKWHGGVCPDITIGGSVLNDGWGSDIDSRVCDDFSSEDKKRWGDCVEAALATGKVTSVVLQNGNVRLETTCTPFEKIEPDADSVAEFGEWADVALEGLR